MRDSDKNSRTIISFKRRDKGSFFISSFLNNVLTFRRYCDMLGI